MVQMQVEQVEHWPLAETVGWEVQERISSLHWDPGLHD